MWPELHILCSTSISCFGGVDSTAVINRKILIFQQLGEQLADMGNCK